MLIDSDLRSRLLGTFPHAAFVVEETHLAGGSIAFLQKLLAIRGDVREGDGKTYTTSGILRIALALLEVGAKTAGVDGGCCEAQGGAKGEHGESVEEHHVWFWFDWILGFSSSKIMVSK